jgi:rhodanese-related sulfurtransferase
MVAQIRPAELKAMLDAGKPVYLLDVRNPDEFAYCRIPDSRLIPLPELIQRLDEVDPPADALVVVYCHYGIRSLSGAAILAANGRPNVASLAGGIEAWAAQVDPAVPRY